MLLDHLFFDFSLLAFSQYYSEQQNKQKRLLQAYN